MYYNIRNHRHPDKSNCKLQTNFDQNYILNNIFVGKYLLYLKQKLHFYVGKYLWL